MPKRSKTPDLTKKRNVWWARKGNPADVRAAMGGKAFLLYNTHETDYRLAQIKAAPIIAGWEDQIARLRRQPIEARNSETAEITAAFLAADPQDPQTADILRRGIDHALTAWKAADRRDALRASVTRDGHLLAALPALSGTDAAIELLRKISAPEISTPLGTYVKDWAASLPKSKQNDQFIKYVTAFVAAHPNATIENLTGGQVQAWIEAQLKAGNAPNTVRFRKTACENYWQWLVANQKASADRPSPFQNRTIRANKKKADIARDKRARFDLHDVPRLWQRAETDGDMELAYAIKLSSHMGWRLEEVCTLRCEGVRFDREFKVWVIRGGMKTQSGIRDIPIPPPIFDLVMTLKDRKDSDDYLIKTDSATQYGDRGHAVGQRFSRMKAKMGFAATHVFHCLRYDYAYLLGKRDANVPEYAQKDLMGHSDTDVTSGYRGETELPDMLAYLTQAIRYPT